MIDINSFRKLTKEQMVSEYEKAIEEYESLENDYGVEVESNNELYSENSDLKGELEGLNEELKYSNDFTDKQIKDIKFGTDLQKDLITEVLKFAEEQGFRFEALDLPVSADGVASNLKENLRLTNRIGDLLVLYFDE